MLIYISLCIFAFSITTTIIYFNPRIQEKRQNKFIEQFCPFEWWNLGHVIFYTSLGYFYQDIWPLIILQSITWEAFEISLDFYEGNWFDLIFNAIGYQFGNYLHEILVEKS